MRLAACLGTICLLALSTLLASAAEPAAPPNIIWIVAEDASPHLSCYGETTIKTPHLDRLAANGIRFTQAFVTCPVCSPSRSAMVSGMYQTTLGSHNHRSNHDGAKGGGNTAYYDSYRVPASIKLIPELLADAGYYVANGGSGKTDYNFLPRNPLYQPADLSRRKPGQPVFLQVQLSGGKARGAKVASPTNPQDVTLPPYYPDHPTLRADWATYLNSWVQLDNQVGELLDDLQQQELLESSVVFFWTDHGVSHLRGKQFLYEEGIHVPLIVRLPRRAMAGKERADLVAHIDIAATTLQLAGLPLPDYIQGRSFLKAGAKPREEIFSARDRCDETVDTIRCVRTRRFKYIRNFLPHVSHMQPNQYKDGKDITKQMRALHAAGRLDELQARVFAAERPAEELYDLKRDPHEWTNLATAPEHQRTLKQLRRRLEDWMIETRDPGLVPEPLLEDLGKKYGSKYDAMRHADQRHLVPQLLDVVDAGQAKKETELRRALESKRPSIRYWACVYLARTSGDAADALRARLQDSAAAVRIAAARALCQDSVDPAALRLLQQEVESPNLIAGMYAIRALEALDERAAPALATVQAARQNKYEFTRRIARRLTSKLED